jgi:hypothetical protein
MGGGGGGNDNAYWAIKKEIDDRRMEVEKDTAAKALEANNKRLALYSGGGLAALATAGYAGYSSAKALGGSTAPLGGA